MENSNKCWHWPTDRELLLRGKMNIGWSVRSKNVFQRANPLLSQELQLIEDVLERSKELDNLECERIGRMICRLNNMTKNILGDGKKTCSMCGIPPGFFSRATFISCHDCSKAVCEKCRIDTRGIASEVYMLCKICAEDREVWKKSGGWFYGKLPVADQICKEVCENQVSGSPGSVRSFETWEHRAPDIVRLESFEPPEENSSDHAVFINWAVSSNPDLTHLEESETKIIAKRLRRKSSEDEENVIPSNCLLTVDIPQLSASCPDLNAFQEDNLPKRGKRRAFMKKKILIPAKNVMSRITKSRSRNKLNDNVNDNH